MSVLVTGASGFVGSALVDHLLRLGMPARALGRTRPEVDAVFFEGALDDPVVSKSALDGVDCVVHLAGLAHLIHDSTGDPLESYRAVNRDLTIALANQAALAGVRRLVFISSIGVNGAVTTGAPFNEFSVPNPHSNYAQSKYEAEQALQALAKDSGMEVVIIRPPLVYGTNAPGNFGNLMHWIGKGVPLPLGAIRNRRSLVGIDNLVDLIIRCIDHPAAANQVLLAGDGEDLSTTELLRGVANAMGKPARLIPVPAGLLQLGATLLGKNDVAQRLLGSLQVDIGKTCELLDWKPPYSVQEGLRRCFEPTHGRASGES
jgi:nucleoside-diphosphate-sugar epimerase